MFKGYCCNAVMSGILFEMDLQQLKALLSKSKENLS